jgi:L-alanine-DL-glutamate epimerase-like enolase superfamily enzyme
MPRVLRLELMSVDLPFRNAFRHAAAARRSSESLFMKCVTDTGAVGFGESLPREYVTGETRDGAFAMLEHSILPRLIGMGFGSMEDVHEFLRNCDGKAPAEWVASRTPQSAAWCTVDLALLDAFGRAFGQCVRLGTKTSPPAGFRYGAVVSAVAGFKFAVSLLKLRLYGFEDVKLKVGEPDVLRCTRIGRRILGKDTTLRVDANMAWGAAEALEIIRGLEHAGVCCVEQPLDANDLEGLARVVQAAKAEIIADESFNDEESLKQLLAQKACTGINVRISKCGGLVAAAARCEDALRASLTLQIGCQVGESSLLSAAQLILISATPHAQYFEGCYGKHLLQDDPVSPCLQLGYGGRPPLLPDGFGLGVKVDEAKLNPWVSRRVLVEGRVKTQKQGNDHVTAGQNDFFADRASYGQRV